MNVVIGSALDVTTVALDDDERDVLATELGYVFGISDPPSDHPLEGRQWFRDMAQVSIILEAYDWKLGDLAGRTIEIPVTGDLAPFLRRHVIRARDYVLDNVHDLDEMRRGSDQWVAYNWHGEPRAAVEQMLVDRRAEAERELAAFVSILHKIDEPVDLTPAEQAEAETIAAARDANYRDRQLAAGLIEAPDGSWIDPSPRRAR